MHCFSSLTPERILDAAELFSVRCTGRILQLNSLENRVFEVEIECDNPVIRQDSFRVIKFYRPQRWTNEQILEEHEYLLDLTNGEVPVVPPLHSKNGLTLEPLNFEEMRCAMFLKSGGRIPQEFNDEEIVRMGMLIARMHLIGATKKAPHRITLTAEGYGTDNCQFLLSARLIHPEYESRYKTIVEEIVKLGAPMLSSVENIRIHGDLHLANILWDDNGPKLVDFDDMVTGPPVQDIWLCAPGRDDYAMRQRELLLDGYSTLRSFDYSSLKLVELLRALRMIHFNAWIGKRWDDPYFQKVFSHYGSPLYWSQAVDDLSEQLEYIKDA